MDQLNGGRPGGGKTRYRTNENAGRAKSLWLDIDCGPDKAAKGKGYATIKEALAALQAFIVAVGLPMPIIVFSGGGLHVYWPLTETIAKEQWIPVARHLKALTQCPATRDVPCPVETREGLPRTHGLQNTEMAPLRVLCDSLESRWPSLRGLMSDVGAKVGTLSPGR